MLPCRLNANLKQVIVGTRVETRRRANVVENAPKVLYHVECRHLTKITETVRHRQMQQ